jgi:hypothetical protein
MASTTPILHVRTGEGGSWLVEFDASGALERLSTHSDATAALRAATTWAREHGGGEVLIHDRYERVRTRRLAPARRPPSGY